MAPTTLFLRHRSRRTFAAIMLLPVILLCRPVPVSAQDHYDPNYLFPGVEIADIRDFNNKNQIVGGSWDGHTGHAQLYLPTPDYGLPAGMNDLGWFPGSTYAYAFSINDYGTIVGGFVPNGSGGGFPEHAMRWRPGQGMEDISGPNERRSVAVGINNRSDDSFSLLTVQGQIVGSALWENNTYSAAVWSWGNGTNDVIGHQFWLVDTLEGRGTAINDNIHSVGMFGGVNGIFQGFYYDWAGILVTTQTIATPYGTEDVIPYSINEREQVVGSDYQGDRAWLWEASTGTSTDLGRGYPGGNREGRGGHGINNQGIVVGNNRFGPPWVWDRVHGRRDLNDLCGLHAGTYDSISHVWSINQRGEILAYRTHYGVVLLRPSQTAAGNIMVDGSNAAQALSLTFRPEDNSPPLVRDTMANACGVFAASDLPHQRYILHIKGEKTLAKNVVVDLSGGSQFDLTIPLIVGDANDDNSINVFDLDLLIQAFNSDPNAENWNPNVDYNNDQSVDVLDLSILISNFNKVGDD